MALAAVTKSAIFNYLGNFSLLFQAIYYYKELNVLYKQALLRRYLFIYCFYFTICVTELSK